MQPNAPSNPPRQPYIPPFKQQQSWQPNQQQGWNNDDDALGTILQALDDLKEGSNRLESKLEDLSRRVRRLEDQEEHNKHTHQQEEDKVNVLETEAFLDLKRLWEFYLEKQIMRNQYKVR